MTTDGFKEYELVKKQADEVGERDRLGAIQIALITGEPYFEVLQRMEASDPTRSKDPMSVLRKTLNLMGYSVSNYPMEKVIARYPMPHSGLKSVTTNHPKRFSAVWPEGTFLLLTNKGEHLALIRDGEVHDWAHDKYLRGEEMFRVTKKR